MKSSTVVKIIAVIAGLLKPFVVKYFCKIQEGILVSLESLRFYMPTKHDGKGGY
jgi:hypothetical protein